MAESFAAALEAGCVAALDFSSYPLVKSIKSSNWCCWWVSDWLFIFIRIKIWSRPQWPIFIQTLLEFGPTSKFRGNTSNLHVSICPIILGIANCTHLFFQIYETWFTFSGLQNNKNIIFRKSKNVDFRTTLIKIRQHAYIILD